MSAERNFADYRLDDDPYELADHLVPEMAAAMDTDIGFTPTEDALQELVRSIGPAKWLQDNIDLVQERLASENDALTTAAHWTERSGVLLPVHRSFVSPEIAIPSEFDIAIFSGGVARWMLRRADHVRKLATVSGVGIREVVVAAGSRQMKTSEHSYISALAGNGEAPTEAHFAANVIVPMLREAGLNARAVNVDSESGDDVMAVLAGEALGGDTVLSVANAPSAIQSTGQFRLATRARDPGFDADGDQLFMSADSLPVARHGEPAATHQNPFTALGQIARNALFLYRNRA